MKTLKYIIAILFLTGSFLACTDQNDDESLEINPVEGLFKIYEISEADHTVEIYSEKSTLTVGYNEFAIRILDKASNIYITNAALTWMPMMHMESMSHSGPHSILKNVVDNTLYKGHIVFQMAGNDMEYWDLTLKYNFNGQEVTVTQKLSVDQPADGMKKTQVFTGADDVRYVLAFVNPKEPKVAINDFQAVLYKMQDMMTFPLVENYKITVDPRMTSMGNHSSPNNQDMVYNSITKMYEGKLSFTMTGYWRINMQLLNENGDVLKGEEVTENHPESSLYFELEF
ncbi:hypothetical protein EI546_07985 [Aequorivita sp. H23M31]|uniref:YtkA-like domain-containing protein n=1 Tax=Aequorivita ciconiae TaxID=2494375 RepID=A0A410G308_9FLAO|nr:hypothetical protein [Aequorivita sp. H23M31]QAA81668.1 hypothetical protein EI546_07985 [Aequorivita sp. H23M31]